jgi:hypothetical protein
VDARLDEVSRYTRVLREHGEVSFVRVPASLVAAMSVDYEIVKPRNALEAVILCPKESAVFDRSLHYNYFQS